MNTIIFSKNRACQLDLLLQGLNIAATVLYTHDNEFESGYKKIIEMYPKISFIKEYDFMNQLIEMIQDDYIMFLVDDDIILESVDMVNNKEFELFKNSDNILCYSIRLAKSFKDSPVDENNMWKWKKYKHSWGYPMSASSTVFRKEDILPIMKKGGFSDPTELEVVLRNNPPKKEYMICSDTPKTIGNFANKVQYKHKNGFKTLGIDPLNLEKKFISGVKISLEKMRIKALNRNDCFMREYYEFE